MFRYVTPKSIDAHPYCYRNTSFDLFFIFRILFTAFKNDTLISYSLRTKEFHTYKGLRIVEKVALDYVNQMIYVIAFLNASDSSKRHIVRLDYADTIMSIVYQGHGSYEPYGLDVFEESIVWKYFKIMYICKLTPNCEQKNVKKLYEDPEVRTSSSFKTNVLK